MENDMYQKLRRHGCEWPPNGYQVIHAVDSDAYLVSKVLLITGFLSLFASDGLLISKTIMYDPFFIILRVLHGLFAIGVGSTLLMTRYRKDFGRETKGLL